MANATYPKCSRLRSGTQYQHVFQHKISVSDTLLVVYGWKNDLRHMRLGVVVSRRVGGAVVRNRWKRLIREAFRLDFRPLGRGIDIVVIPRRNALPSRLYLNDVRKSLSRLGRKLFDRLEKGGRR